jgi:hypothetical protein
MDSSSSSFLDHPISDLVGAFLEAAQAVVASSDPEVSEARPAELTYELDQVVSNYLDVHQLSPEHYEVIQQNVVNSIAQHLSDDASEHGSAVQLDEQGNAGLTDVISMLDHHYSLAPQHDPIPDSSAFFPDGGHHSGLG